MNVYTNCDFEGFYPVGTGAVVVAETPQDAANQLNCALRDNGLKATAKAEDMNIIDTEVENVVILCDGNY